MSATSTPPPLRLGTTTGRWVVVVTVLGSGVVFIEGTVVNIAVPSMARDLGLGMSGVQWVLNGYFLSLAALMLLGGSLGDRYGHRRIFRLGLLGFGAASLACALAPSLPSLVAFRVVQGAAGALLVPNSLALLNVSFARAERGAAIGLWSGWSAISTAAGPLLGGWLVDLASWRWVFGLIAPLALGTAWLAASRLAEHPRSPATASAGVALDWKGAALSTTGLGMAFGALIAGQERGFGDPWIVGLLAVAGALLLGFLLLEDRAAEPLIPWDLLRSRQFAGGNLITLLVYTALSTLFFLLVVHLQNTLDYSALAAGAALLPVYVLLLLLSSRAGQWGSRLGPGWLVGAGAFLVAIGFLLLSGLGAGDPYLSGVLPGLGLFGLGLALLVAPLTDAVLSAAGEGRGGIASGVNNSVSRLAGMTGTAALPLAAGLGGLEDLGGLAFVAGYGRAMQLAAVLCAVAAILAPWTLRTAGRAPPIRHPSPTHGCVERPGE